MVTANFSDLNSGNMKLRKKFETSYKMHVESNVGLAGDLEKTRDDFVKKSRESDARRTRGFELEKGLATLLDVRNASEKKIEVLELQVDLDASASA